MLNEAGAAECGRARYGCGREMGIDRRTMRSQGVVLAPAALAACGNNFDIPTAPASVAATIKVSDHPSLASVGGVAAVSASGSPVAVVRTGTDSFIARSPISPHQGSTLGVVNDGFAAATDLLQIG